MSSKVDSLYRKDKNCGKCIQPVFSQEVFSIIKKWEVFEYFNGMFLTIKSNSGSLEILGKSAKTQIPKPLKEYIEKIFSENLEENCTFYLDGSIYNEKPCVILIGGKVGSLEMRREDLEMYAKSFRIYCSLPLCKTEEDLSKMESVRILLETYKFSKFYRMTFDKEILSEGLLLSPVIPITHEGKKVQAKIVRNDFIL